MTAHIIITIENETKMFLTLRNIAVISAIKKVAERNGATFQIVWEID